MNAVAEVWFVVIITALTVAGVYLMLGNSLRELIYNLVDSKPCETFYSRVLLLGLVFVGLIGVLETKPHLMFAETVAPTGRTFMESVWNCVEKLTETFGIMLFVLFVYLIVITILTAALNRRKA